MLPDLIKETKSVLLHLHVKPDPDSIGSALAMYHALLGLGKKVTVIKGDSSLPEIFSFLPGFKDIVLKNYFEIDVGEFDLFIVQDSGSKDMISRKGEVIFPDHLKTIVIDHHKTNTKFGDVNFVDASYSSTAEYLYDLFKEWGIEITKDIAQCLYIGIYGDTGGFRYSTTTTRTMSVIAELTRIYPDFPKLIEVLEYNNSKEKIYFDAIALGLIETFFDGRVALSCIPFKTMEEKGITREMSDNNIVAGTLLTVKDWEVTGTLIEKAPGEISISFRSKNNKDVSEVAVALGGGGHKFASGTNLWCSLEEAKNKVLETLTQVIYKE
ncbi:MAG: bifunctional oligoribonuclease/PAP phosphatase NrnA [Candidatus Paceibacterota bacterium]|jgi:phosphoesterase RecJ-like protein